MVKNGIILSGQERKKCFLPGLIFSIKVKNVIALSIWKIVPGQYQVVPLKNLSLKIGCFIEFLVAENIRLFSFPWQQSLEKYLNNFLIKFLNEYRSFTLNL